MFTVYTNNKPVSYSFMSNTETWFFVTSNPRAPRAGIILKRGLLPLQTRQLLLHGQS